MPSRAVSVGARRHRFVARPNPVRPCRRHNAACLPATATAGCSARRDLCGLVPDPAQL